MERKIVNCAFTDVKEKRPPDQYPFHPIISEYAEECERGLHFHSIVDDIVCSTPLGATSPVDTIKNASLVIIWNGSRHYAKPISKICSVRSIPKFYMERGMLPQRQNFFIDPLGFYGDSILTKDLSWINTKDIDAMLGARNELQQEYEISPQGYVFVPLQIENDSSVLYHSHYNNMSELLEYVEYMYPNKKIVAKFHPYQEKDTGFINKLTKRFEKITFETGVALPRTSKGFLPSKMFELASKADVVVGITSTCLYECAILGVPVVALGNHPLRMNRKEDFDKVLAGAFVLNLNRSKGKLRPVLERFNIKPL